MITSISLDHTAYLGDTVEQIAAEKAGIIKEGVPVIFDGTDPGAAAVIEARAKALHADCRKLGKNAFEIREITRKHIAFSRGSAYDKDELWTIRGCGTYQMMNVSLALAALETVLPEEYVDYERWKKRSPALSGRAGWRRYGRGSSWTELTIQGLWKLLQTRWMRSGRGGR